MKIIYENNFKQKLQQMTFTLRAHKCVNEQSFSRAASEHVWSKFGSKVNEPRLNIFFVCLLNESNTNIIVLDSLSS